MMLTLLLATVSASLGFFTGALLCQRRRCESQEAYLTLAAAVHDFTHRHVLPGRTLQLSDLLVPQPEIRRLSQALDRSQRLYHPQESTS